MAATSFFRRVVLRIDTQHVDFAKVTESTPLLPLARRAVERYSSSDEKKTLQWAVATDSHATKNAEDEACSPCRTRASDGDYTVAAFIIGFVMIIAHYPWIGTASDLIKRGHTSVGVAVIVGWVLAASAVIFYVTIATLDQVAFDVAWHRNPDADEGCPPFTAVSR